jgi:transcriptional regulator with XRE-family HTH domain
MRANSRPGEVTEMQRTIERLKQAIAERGMLSRIAEKCDVAPSTVLRISRGETKDPGFSTMESIERALDELENPAPAAKEVGA